MTDTTTRRWRVLGYGPDSKEKATHDETASGDDHLDRVLKRFEADPEIVRTTVAAL